jgi:anaerobic ribonucleoside-triphosphate reductase
MQHCDKCDKEIREIDLGNGLELLEAKCLKFKDETGEYFVVRCDKCYEKDTSLTNYKKTEVFTRTVGYYRPVQNFHKGKVAEYNDRVEFSQNNM